MPTLTIQNPSIPSGTNLDFNFSGFPANTPITVFGQGEGQGPVVVTSDASGAGSGSIPDVGSVPTTWTLYAEDLSNGYSASIAWASVTFTVTTAPTGPEIYVQTPTIQLGQNLVIVLYYFSPNSTVTVKVGTAAAGYQTFFTEQTGAAVSGTNYSGGLQVNVSTQNVVAEAGTYTLIATDTQGKTAQATFTVSGLAASTTPVIKIQNPSIPSDGTMVFNFSGFTPNSAVTVTSTGIVGGGASAGTAGADGTGSSAVKVVGMVGNYTLTVTDAEGKKATASFAVTTGGPSITGTWSGTSFNFTVSGFPAKDTLTITAGIAGQSPVYTGTVTTGSDGTASGSINAAGFAMGTYILGANDESGNGAVYDFAITTKPTTGAGTFGLVTISISQALPADTKVGTPYPITGTAKIFGKIGAPPWVYAKMQFLGSGALSQFLEKLEPSLIKSITLVRGFPNPATGAFTINWTPPTAGDYAYTVISTPAPLGISSMEAVSDILNEPILAQTSPVLGTTAS